MRGKVRSLIPLPLPKRALRNTAGSRSLPDTDGEIEMLTKLEAFRAALEAATRQAYREDWEREQNKPNGLRYDLAIHDRESECKIKIGRKYANVDVGTSGRYMVELATGAIYGIKAYGVIHRGHYYGTLDTIDQYDWRGYTAVKRQSVAV